MINYLMKILLVIISLLTIYFVISFFLGNSNKNMQTQQSLQISTPVFSNNQSIPSKYTCDGENKNPDLKISGIVSEAKSLVLIMDDPDAPRGVWDHWVKFNIPVSDSEFNIEEGIEPAGVSGVGTSGHLNYEGPCPPDKEHRYFFKVYVLDTMLDLKEGSTKEDVERAMQNHILQSGELVGLYNRKK